MDEGCRLSWESSPLCHWLTLSTKDTPSKKSPEIKQLKGTQPNKPAKFWIRHLQSILFVHIFFSWKRTKMDLKMKPRNTRSSPSWKIIIFQGFQVQLWGFFIGESSWSPMRSFRNVGNTATLLVKRSSAAGSKRKTFMCSAWLLANLFPRKFPWDLNLRHPWGFRKISVTTTFRYIFSRDPMYAPYKNL